MPSSSAPRSRRTALAAAAALPFAAVTGGTWLGLGLSQEHAEQTVTRTAAESSAALLSEALTALRATSPAPAAEAMRLGQSHGLSIPATPTASPRPAPGASSAAPDALSLAADAVRAARSVPNARAEAWGWLLVIAAVRTGTPKPALGDLVASSARVTSGDMDEAARAASESAFWHRAAAAQQAGSERSAALSTADQWARRALELVRLGADAASIPLSYALPRSVTLAARLSALTRSYTLSVMRSRTAWGDPAPTTLPGIVIEALRL